MQTPAGKECPHYYADYYRGRETEECRLVKSNPDSESWQPRDCSTCTVPDIIRANASPDLNLTLTIQSRLLGLQRKLVVKATCGRHHIPVENPYIGCPECNEHPGLDIFRQALGEDSNTDD